VPRRLGGHLASKLSRRPRCRQDRRARTPRLGSSGKVTPAEAPSREGTGTNSVFA
jgi:hypothetical protein